MEAKLSSKSKNTETAQYNGRVTYFVILSCIMASTGGVIFGYDIGISGGVTSMAPFLNKFFPEVYKKMEGDANTSNYCKFNSQLLTSFTSSLYLAGLIASFFASSVTRSYGRKSSMLMGGIAFLAGASLGGAAVNVYMVILGRVLLGIGVGFANQSVPLYLAEMSPSHYRGIISNGFHFSISIGFISATLINFGTEKIHGNLGWRISLALASVPAALLTIAAVILPETPNSLIQRGVDIQKVETLLQKIRGTLNVNDELLDMIKASNSSKTVHHPFREIVKRKYRPQLVMAILIPFFQQNPRDEHWKAVKRILRYLNGTTNYGITLEACKRLNISGYSDSDWAADMDDRRSTTGYCVYLGRNPVSWCSKKQPTISRSSTEAEYRSVASITAEIMWIQSLLTELKVKTEIKPTIWCDNLSTISLTANPILHSRTKHMELDLYFVREQVAKGKLCINHIPGAYQKADILTKALSTKNFSRFRQELRVDEGGARIGEEHKT